MKKISTLVAALLLLFSNALSAQECVIKMKTAHAIGEYMGFSIQSNGNEVDIIGAEHQSDGSFKVTAQEVELRGKITRLDCSSNWLESIDVSGNNLLVYGAQNEAYMSRSAEKWVKGLCFNELGVSG